MIQLAAVAYGVSGYLAGSGLLGVANPAEARAQLACRRLEVPPELRQRILQLANRMSLRHAEKLDVFVTNGLSAVSFGDLRLGSSVILGVPRTILARDPARAHLLDALTLSGVPVGREDPAARHMRELLLPTEEHVDFTLAHELAHLAHSDTVTGTLARPFSIAGGFFVARRLVERSRNRLVAASSVTMLAAALLTLQVSIRWLQELRADAAAAGLGERFRIGGIQSLQKRRELNLLLRESWVAQHGTAAGSGISPTGDISGGLALLSHPPLWIRLLRLRQMGPAL